LSDENRKKHGAEAPKDGGSDAEPNGTEKPGGDADRRESVSPDAGFPIVGIGASAGGLEALRDFFGAVPADSGMAFVVIQHLDPTHKSHMVDVLVKHTDMPVLQAKQGMRVEANTVYLIPPNAYMTVRDCELHLEEPIKRAGVRMPIDFFFRSLAEDQQERSICVVLSGSGSDGMLGVRAIRGAGGMAMVQDPETAAHDSMPRRAIATGLVDYVLPVREMPAALVSYVRQSYLHGPRPPEGAAPEAPADVGTVLNLLLVRANSDFRGYKKGTVLRRIQRRMGLSQTASLVDYVRLLRQDPEEVSRLAKDMLVGVTGFFRDPEAFDELRRQAVIPLVSGKVDDSGLRAWIPGCATGEEAYSIAIMLLEELSNAGKVAPVQIFASDIDEEALELGRSGIYPESIASDVSAERLERFFTRQDHTYQVNKEVRECVLFAAQNLITGPPFSKLDLISCRNVLIYLEPEVQRRVSSLFAFALRPGRYLLLGKSDSLADEAKIFEPVSKRWRIYRRTAVPHHEAVEFPVRARGQLVPNAPVEAAGARHAAALAAANQQVLLEHFGAAVVLIDATGQIAHFHGTTSRYLEHPSGTAGLNVFDMVWDGLSRRLRHSVRRALESKEAVRLEGVPLTREGDDWVDVTVRPVVQSGGVEPLLALFFEEKAGSEPLAAAVEAESAEDIPLVQQLERELGAAREELQASSEEFETTNEELRAAHEEAMSVNEELQSTNEELETSKEELQSVNEELTTVNNQLSDKIEELDAANSDLANLMGSTDVATVFFDRELRVRRFTAQATKVLNLISSDVGKRRRSSPSWPRWKRMSELRTESGSPCASSHTET
jgi:two-component system CheB/CheR fusion protein